MNVEAFLSSFYKACEIHGRPEIKAQVERAVDLLGNYTITTEEFTRIFDEARTQLCNGKPSQIELLPKRRRKKPVTKPQQQQKEQKEPVDDVINTNAFLKEFYVRIAINIKRILDIRAEEQVYSKRYKITSNPGKEIQELNQKAQLENTKLFKKPVSVSSTDAITSHFLKPKVPRKRTRSVASAPREGTLITEDIFLDAIRLGKYHARCEEERIMMPKRFNVAAWKEAGLMTLLNKIVYI